MKRIALIIFSIRKKVRKEFYRKIGASLRTELNRKDEVIAINSLAISVVTYSFNIIRELKKWLLNLANL